VNLQLTALFSSEERVDLLSLLMNVSDIHEAYAVSVSPLPGVIGQLAIYPIIVGVVIGITNGHTAYQDQRSLSSYRHTLSFHIREGWDEVPSERHISSTEVLLDFVQLLHENSRNFVC
jgi:hypothetical protein